MCQSSPSPWRSRELSALSAVPFLLSECLSAHPRVHGACACVGTCVVCAHLHGGVYCVGPCVFCVRVCTGACSVRAHVCCVCTCTHVCTEHATPAQPHRLSDLNQLSSCPGPQFRPQFSLAQDGGRGGTRVLAGGEGGGSTVSSGVLPETTLVHSSGCRGGNAYDH